ncbi:acetyltransferase [Vibrio metschnikovii]|uniref:Acetyltransferase n=2 Tax=Unclassified Bacteria TaxID=49928 RepID=A0AAU6UNE4_UNCXX|nr:acetyltransferase [Vibrio metschnikovii]EKO3609272.1 acetyltransferase [Vibrio metschnikovii]EKO3616839.1 acetyltransferase [Vibrio metschnikovii]EKO3655552.1 acetyltransferase [Vibrio metschnikovii]EKO3682074.1 acetyltransferase [Vibrio metschnikovii]
MSKFNTFIFSTEPQPVIELTLQASDLICSDIAPQLIREMDQLFSQEKQIETLKVAARDPETQTWIEQLLPLIDQKVSRCVFYQLPLAWHQHKPSSRFPLQLIQSNNQYRPHPLRPPMPQGQVYQRYNFDVELSISFRVIELDKDLQRFTRWMNTPRVAHFWEQAWSEEKLAEFIEQRLAQPHIIPLIGEFNGEPFGYIEAYWVAEDRLSPYYAVESYDRGIHLLVGEQAFRGPKYFDAWMRAISHYLFIDDVRTNRIVLEPRADNERLFDRILPLGYQKCFEFNFPHKRSALLMLTREQFFAERW